MASLEERITTVEAQTDGHTRATDRLQQEVTNLRGEMHGEFRAVRSEIADLRADMNRRFDMMDQKFTWFVGSQIATLLAVVGVLAGALYR